MRTICHIENPKTKITTTTEANNQIQRFVKRVNNNLTMAIFQVKTYRNQKPHNSNNTNNKPANNPINYHNSMIGNIFIRCQTRIKLKLQTRKR